MILIQSATSTANSTINSIVRFVMALFEMECRRFRIVPLQTRDHLFW